MCLKPLALREFATATIENARKSQVARYLPLRCLLTNRIPYLTQTR